MVKNERGLIDDQRAIANFWRRAGDTMRIAADQTAKQFGDPQLESDIAPLLIDKSTTLPVKAYELLKSRYPGSEGFAMNLAEETQRNVLQQEKDEVEVTAGKVQIKVKAETIFKSNLRKLISNIKKS